MVYFYTPVVQNADSGVFEVGKDEGGSVVSAMADLVGGIDALKLDQGIPRYILACPDSQEDQSGWDKKTAQEVNTDYPGLIQV